MSSRNAESNEQPKQKKTNQVHFELFMGIKTKSVFESLEYHYEISSNKWAYPKVERLQ